MLAPLPHPTVNVVSLSDIYEAAHKQAVRDVELDMLFNPPKDGSERD